MRTLIISDVHSNLTALEKVLEDAQPFDQVWCLGDVIGYGPDPNECISRIRELPLLKCVKGNHDAAIIGDINIRAFNYEARASLKWLESVITFENKRWLAALDEMIVVDDVTLVHGSPTSFVWEYVMDVQSARENMDAFTTLICLVGHTHVPIQFTQVGEDLKTTKRIPLTLDEPFELNHKSILNPGSVGQPRDHDPRASYMIYDDKEGKWSFHRILYDFKEVQERILAAGLPNQHAYRLSKGW